MGARQRSNRGRRLERPQPSAPPAALGSRARGTTAFSARWRAFRCTAPQWHGAKAAAGGTASFSSREPAASLRRGGSAAARARRRGRPQPRRRRRQLDGGSSTNRSGSLANRSGDLAVRVIVCHHLAIREPSRLNARRLTPQRSATLRGAVLRADDRRPSGRPENAASGRRSQRRAARGHRRRSVESAAPSRSSNPPLRAGELPLRSFRASRPRDRHT